MLRPIWLAALVLAAGCSTHVDRLVSIRDAYHAGDLPRAEASITDADSWRTREKEVLDLDRAVVRLGEGKPREAERLLREARDRLDELEATDLAGEGLSLLLDDQSRPYAGDDHEKVLLRAFLALANLMSDGGDARAYALQADAKQAELLATKDEDLAKARKAYPRPALGAYLHAALREETHLNYDDAARSLEQVVALAPDFAPAKADLDRARKGRHSPPGHGVVYVFTLVGKGPYKEEKAEIVTQAALLIADRIVSAVGKHSIPPTVAPVKVPRVVVPCNAVQSVAVQVGPQLRGRTETVTDVGALAKAQADALLPAVIGRAVARRVLKKAMIAGVKEWVGLEPTGVSSLLLDVTGVVWEATESADTRCWGLLPEKVQVLRLELPAGEHELALTPTDAGGAPIGPPRPARVRVADGRNTYVLASFPTAALAGRILSGPERP